MKVIIALDGSTIREGYCPENTFQDVYGAPNDSYVDSVNSEDLNLVTMISPNGTPVGYCSFHTDLGTDYKNAENVWGNFGIYYVYLTDEYRGKGLSRYFSEFIFNYLTSNYQNFTHYIDSSNYVSFQGEIVGDRIRKKLESMGIPMLP